MKEKIKSEIQRLIKAYSPIQSAEGKYKVEAYEDLLTFIGTLEVKEVKEPTASDSGMAEEIIINLKRVEQDYHIDLTREMEWVRNKTQKGE